MTRLRILYCDDKPEAHRTFAARHGEHYDIEALSSLRDVPRRLQQLAAEGRDPDVLLLDLYHPCEVDDPGTLQGEAEAKLRDLSAMLADVKTAVERAYSPAAIDLLEEIRRTTPARRLPTMIYTRRGLLLLDDADLRRIRRLDAGWLIKDPGRIQADTGGAYIENFVQQARGATGQSVFIGHGRSTQWQQLRDFVSNDLGLPFEEFNRVAPEGKTIVERLGEMLDTAAIALLVLTAEDQHADGTSVARQNVVHEAGLFAGRLGFHKAILLLEEGCADFTNVHGLVAIRYPRNISLRRLKQSAGCSTGKLARLAAALASMSLAAGRLDDRVSSFAAVPPRSRRCPSCPRAVVAPSVVDTPLGKCRQAKTCGVRSRSINSGMAPRSACSSDPAAARSIRHNESGHAVSPRTASSCSGPRGASGLDRSPFHRAGADCRRNRVR